MAESDDNIPDKTSGQAGKEPQYANREARERFYQRKPTGGRKGWARAESPDDRRGNPRGPSVR